MKSIWIVGALLVLVGAPIRLPAQVDNDSGALTEIKTKAEQGDAAAQWQLSCRYGTGIGLEKNEGESVKWCQKSAAQGYTAAELCLGAYYAEGKSTPQDYKEALKWFKKAADKGDPEAITWMGSCYFMGLGVTKDVNQGLKFWHQAADAGSALAQAKIGDCYYYGDNVAQDYGEAVKWYKLASQKTEAPVAQYTLGLCYFNGQGVAKDYVEAYKWLNIAAAQGVEDAKRCLNIAEHRMTSAQIAEAQRLTRQFNEHKPQSENPSSQENAIGSGTGFFITEDGCLITSYHVIEGATKIRLITGAGTIPAEIVKVDAANDLALLKAKGKFAALAIASSRSARLGSTVITLGYPSINLQGVAPKFARGEIAALSGAGDDVRYFQISVPLQPGNSGGALVDEHGNVIGVVAAKLNALAAINSTGALPENVNYAVKSSFLLSFLESTPDVLDRLKVPNAKDESVDDVVKSAKEAAVLVLVY